MAHEEDRLTLEKLKLDKRMSNIEKFMEHGERMREQIQESMRESREQIKSLNETIYGKEERPGITDRIRELEKERADREKITDGFLKVAIGSMAMAVGAFLLWLSKLILSAIGKQP